MATTTINLGLSLDGLSNVDSTGKNNGDILRWNSTTNNWEDNTVDTTPTDGSTNLIDSNAVFDALTLKQDKLFIHKETTPSAAVTGTLTETQAYALTIPANSFSAGDKFVLDSLIFSKIGAAGTATIRIKLSTSSTLPAAENDRIVFIGTTATILYSGISRFFNINGGNLIGIANNQQTNDAYVSTAGAIQIKAFDPTVTNYLYISVTLANIADSVTFQGYTLKNF
jgi:hypothetical protein